MLMIFTRNFADIFSLFLILCIIIWSISTCVGWQYNFWRIR